MPVQGPYFCCKPVLISSTSPSSSHRCPSQGTTTAHGWTASPPEMSSGTPRTAQGQAVCAQNCLCPSSPSSHLLFLHPSARTISPSTASQRSVPPRDLPWVLPEAPTAPSWSPAPWWPRPGARWPLRVPARHPQARAHSLPSPHPSVQVTLTCLGWPPNCTPSLSDLHWVTEQEQEL